MTALNWERARREQLVRRNGYVPVYSDCTFPDSHVSIAGSPPPHEAQRSAKREASAASINRSSPTRLSNLVLAARRSLGQRLSVAEGPSWSLMTAPQRSSCLLDIRRLVRELRNVDKSPEGFALTRRADACVAWRIGVRR